MRPRMPDLLAMAGLALAKALQCPGTSWSLMHGDASKSDRCFKRGPADTRYAHAGCLDVCGPNTSHPFIDSEETNAFVASLFEATDTGVVGSVCTSSCHRQESRDPASGVSGTRVTLEVSFTRTRLMNRTGSTEPRNVPLFSPTDAGSQSRAHFHLRQSLACMSPVCASTLLARPTRTFTRRQGYTAPRMQTDWCQSAFKTSLLQSPFSSSFSPELWSVSCALGSIIFAGLA